MLQVARQKLTMAGKIAPSMPALYAPTDELMMPKKKMPRKETEVQKKRRLYRMKIGCLAYRAVNGDVKAEALLQEQLKKNPASRKIVTAIIKNRSIDSYQPRDRLRKPKYSKGATPLYGTAFKPFSGFR